MNGFLDKDLEGLIDIQYIMDKLEVITPYGKSLRGEMTPFITGQEMELVEELENIEKFVPYINIADGVLSRIRSIFHHIKDIRTSIDRSVNGDILTEIELFEIKGFIMNLIQLKGELSKLPFTLPKDMEVDLVYELEKLLDPRGEGLSTFYIYDEYSDNLKHIREEAKKLKNEIRIQRKLVIDQVQKELGIKVNHLGHISISKIDIDTIRKVERCPYLIYSSETYMDVRYSLKSTETIVNLERKLDGLIIKEENEEVRIRYMLSSEIALYSSKILKNMRAIGRLDLTIAKAYFAIDIKGVKPEITKEHVINITEGRHIRVEETLKSKNKRFTPITVELREGATCITGANMGGKTVTLKLIGMLCLMAQYGLYVPCDEMKLGLSSFIHISMGDTQSTDRGLSTFGGEVRGIQKAIDRSDEKGLILIDELARGTNPEEGCAISRAIVNYLKDKNCISVITTHYDNIAYTDGVVHLQVIGLANVDYARLKELTNFDSGMDLISQYMDYRLKEVKNSSEVPRDAIKIARLMGLDKTIISFAEKELRKY